MNTCDVCGTSKISVFTASWSGKNFCGFGCEIRFAHENDPKNPSFINLVNHFACQSDCAVCKTAQEAKKGVLL